MSSLPEVSVYGTVLYRALDGNLSLPMNIVKIQLNKKLQDCSGQWTEMPGGKIRQSS
jgi:hypothetical protein